MPESFLRWLIERGQTEGFNDAEWLTPFGEWTRNPRLAVKYPLESYASAEIGTMGLSARPVAHEFAGPLPPEAFPHVAPLQAAFVTYRDGKLAVEREDKS